MPAAPLGRCLVSGMKGQNRYQLVIPEPGTGLGTQKKTLFKFLKTQLPFKEYLLCTKLSTLHTFSIHEADTTFVFIYRWGNKCREGNGHLVNLWQSLELELMFFTTILSTFLFVKLSESKLISKFCFSKSPTTLWKEVGDCDILFLNVDRDMKLQGLRQWLVTVCLYVVCISLGPHNNLDRFVFHPYFYLTRKSRPRGLSNS